MAATVTERPAFPTRKIPALPPPLQSPATRSSPCAVMATADRVPSTQPPADAVEATAPRPANRVQVKRSLVLTSTPPLATGAGAARASRCVPPEAARASGTPARATGRIPPVHTDPASAVSASGENRRSSETPNPVVSPPSGLAATMMPPLLATPGGVARDQCGPPLQPDATAHPEPVSYTHLTLPTKRIV